MSWKRTAVARGIPAILSLVLLSSCAGSSKYMRPAALPLTPTSGKALVRFMRPSGFGYTINFNIFDGTKVIGNSVAKAQFDYLADPGHHVFAAIAENKVFLEADLVAGKVYYVITRIYPGAWRGRVAFVAITRGSEYWDEVLKYEKELNRLEPDEAKLRVWEDGHKQEITALRAAYESEFKAKYDWPKLKPEDGR